MGLPQVGFVEVHITFFIVDMSPITVVLPSNASNCPDKISSCTEYFIFYRMQMDILANPFPGHKCGKSQRFS
jgi:hypothetical protein